MERRYCHTKGFTPLENAPRLVTGSGGSIRARGSISGASSLTGFTFLEVLIAVAIVAMLSATAFVSFNKSRHIRDLTTSSQNVLSVLRLAQSRTLAGENDSAWGVRLASNQVTLFQGDTFAGSPLTKIYPLPSSVQLTNILLNGGGSDVVFKRVTGETDQTGTFGLSVIDSPSDSFSVTIDSLGKVYQTSAPPPTHHHART